MCVCVCVCVCVMQEKREQGSLSPARKSLPQAQSRFLNKSQIRRPVKERGGEGSKKGLSSSLIQTLSLSLLSLNAETYFSLLLLLNFQS